MKSIHHSGGVRNWSRYPSKPWCHAPDWLAFIVGLEGIVAAVADKRKSFGIDIEYKFSKKHHLQKPPKYID